MADINYDALRKHQDDYNKAIKSARQSGKPPEEIEKDIAADKAAKPAAAMNAAAQQPAIKSVEDAAAADKAAEQAAKAQAVSNMYKIQRGDTLGNIAKASGISVADLMKLNGITDPNRIIAGKELNLGSGNMANVNSGDWRERNIANWQNANNISRNRAERAAIDNYVKNQGFDLSNMPSSNWRGNGGSSQSSQGLTPSAVGLSDMIGRNLGGTAHLDANGRELSPFLRYGMDG